MRSLSLSSSAGAKTAGCPRTRFSSHSAVRVVRVQAYRNPNETSPSESSAPPPVQRKMGGERLRTSLAKMPVHFTQGEHSLGYSASHEATTYKFFSPPLALMGPGCLEASGEELRAMGFRNALIVTDGVLSASGALTPVTEMLEAVGIQYKVFNQVAPNPTSEQCIKGLEMFKAADCDCILSFGGGSPHDCAKMISILATNGGVPRDYEGLNKVRIKPTPLVCINTTAGTGAEMTRFTIITDKERKIKMAIIDGRCTPILAVNDPTLMVAMPPALTAATGMDALTHALEAYLSTESTPVTDACALHAIRLITTYLRDAVKDGEDIRARDMMAYAEYLAGLAFNAAGLGYVHACSHQLGGWFGLPHGVSNAILLPVVMEYNGRDEKTAELFADISTAMGFCAIPGDLTESDARQAVKTVLDEIKSLSRDVGIPKNLAAFDVVNPAEFGKLAENAMKDACGTTNPRQPSFEEVQGFFMKAYEQ